MLLRCLTVNFSWRSIRSLLILRVKINVSLDDVLQIFDCLSCTYRCNEVLISGPIFIIVDLKDATLLIEKP